MKKFLFFAVLTFCCSAQAAELIFDYADDEPTAAEMQTTEKCEGYGCPCETTQDCQFDEYCDTASKRCSFGKKSI